MGLERLDAGYFDKDFNPIKPESGPIPEIKKPNTKELQKEIDSIRASNRDIIRPQLDYLLGNFDSAKIIGGEEDIQGHGTGTKSFITDAQLTLAKGSQELTIKIPGHYMEEKNDVVFISSSSVKPFSPSMKKFEGRDIDSDFTLTDEQKTQLEKAIAHAHETSSKATQTSTPWYRKLPFMS